ncbi:MAG: DUF3836 domain-containing protein [Bacteroides sp.]|nr:DUF3836 domain-containing protein [Bacteroides sp.]
MKTTVLRSVMCVAFVIAGFMSTNLNAGNKFYTNEIVKDGVMVSKVIYSYDGTLHQQAKHDFTYNEAGKVTSKEVFKWNEESATWTPSYKIDCTYGNDTITLNYALWNAKDQSYNLSQQKSLYRMDAAQNYIAYQNYKWDASENGWMLTNNVSFDNENTLLTSIM